MQAAASEEDFRALFENINCKVEKKKLLLSIDLDISQAQQLFNLPDLFENVLCKGVKLCYHKEKK